MKKHPFDVKHFTVCISNDFYGWKPSYRFDGWPINRAPGHVWYRTFKWMCLWVQLDNEVYP